MTRDGCPGVVSEVWEDRGGDPHTHLGLAQDLAGSRATRQLPPITQLAESYNGHGLRGECLNTNWFYECEANQGDHGEAGHDFNEVRPHSSLKA